MRGGLHFRLPWPIQISYISFEIAPVAPINRQVRAITRRSWQAIRVLAAGLAAMRMRMSGAGWHVIPRKRVALQLICIFGCAAGDVDGGTTTTKEHQDEQKLEQLSSSRANSGALVASAWHSAGRRTSRRRLSHFLYASAVC